MLWTPPIGFGAIQTNLIATPSSTGLNGTTCTGGVAHTKGSWTQAIASTNFDVQWIDLIIGVTGSATTATECLLDVGLGPATEVVVMSNLLAGYVGRADAAGNTPFIRGISVPFFIPRGTRISTRCQGVQASKTINVMLFLHGGARGPLPSFTRIDDYGTSLAASRGTSHTPGNTGAESAWANIGATTSRAYDAVMLMATGFGTAQNGRYYNWEIGYSSTSLGEYMTVTSTNEFSTQAPLTPVFQQVPSGTQLQARAECSSTAQACDVALYGLA